MARFGRYQCEAAIQSVHVQRPITGTLNVRALLTLYDLLVAKAPTVGVRVARAAMLAEAGDLAAARAGLDAIPAARCDGYQPYWVVLATLHRRAGDTAAAGAALDKALALTEDPAVRAYLQRSLGRPVDP